MSPKSSSTLRRLGIGCAATLLIAVVAAFILFKSFDKSLPTGEVGPAADEMARAMMTAANIDAWHQTGAVEWDFAGRQQHLWDRDRGYVRVRWQQNEVLLELETKKGIARQDGQPLDAEAAAPLLEQAWSFWCNDSFWLNPVAKLFDDGTTRALAPLDGGGQGLLITYGSGGVTPGDSYLWAVGDDGLPTAWWMWTQILPLGGIEASWDGWITLDTGARVATLHDVGVLDLQLKDVRGAASLAELVDGEDPFAALESL